MTLKRAESPLEDWTGVFGSPTMNLHIKRDDLLPFPLAGNKFRKLLAEFALIDPSRHVIVTVGSVTSNHCRTTAMLAARHNIPVHLVLHSESLTTEAMFLGARLLHDLGAEFTVVPPSHITLEIENIERDIRSNGRTPYVIEGGCHTPAGVRAYADAVHELAQQVDSPPDVIVVPSGTGATQAGIIVGRHQVGWDTRVIGISIARGEERGRAAVEEAIKWVAPKFDCDIEFTDTYSAGGYGRYDATTRIAVSRAWSKGLPTDPIYTGKAFAGVLDLIDSPNGLESALFWHTGGLFQYLSENKS